MNGCVAILIPAFNPDGKLVSLVQELKKRFSHVLVVNDGSTTGSGPFVAVEGMGVPVLEHVTNRGKGVALKTGFAWIQANWPDCRAVVTADADGQHRPDDIERVAEASIAYPGGLTLGVRTFTGKVPMRSRFGNWWSRQFFWLMSRQRLSDTQTGLRGIPAGILPRMLTLEGDRYEYEMAMLADARFHEAPPMQVSIATVYLDGNCSSHFNPLVDAIRIYRVLLKFCLGSILGFVVDNLVFTVALVAGMQWAGWSRAAAMLVAILSARFVSATINFACNHRFVFGSSVSKRKSFTKYWLLVLAIMSAGYACTAMLSWFLDARGLAITMLKIVIETLLFFVSYDLQKRWVFRAKGESQNPSSTGSSCASSAARCGMSPSTSARGRLLSAARRRDADG